MTIYMNGKRVSVDLAVATRQDIADFCIYDVTELMNESKLVLASIKCDIYCHGNDCYNIEDTETCYAINSGVTQILSYIGTTYDEVEDMIKALESVNYMTGNLDAIPSTKELKVLAKALDKLYEVIDDELYKFIKSDWYEGRGL